MSSTASDKSAPPTRAKSHSDSLDLFLGGGEMGGLMRAFDWSRTPLGSPADWPQSLKTSLSICLASRFPIVLYWGPELVVLYNDAYSLILGSKHPWALGQTCRVCWAEIWDTIGPMLDGVIKTGKATWSDDLLLMLRRFGYPEECYFSFSFTPVQVESGAIGGVFTAVIETTEKVIGERRLRTLRDLAARAVAARSEQDAWQIAAVTLDENRRDVPFAILYQSAGEAFRVAGTAGITSTHPLCAALCQPGSELFKKAVQVAASGVRAELEDISSLAINLPNEPWDTAPTQGLLLPIAPLGQGPSGVLFAAASPAKTLDESYRTFFDLVARQIATSLADARAYEEERKRAEALAELDRAKTLFFSNISHELRTPLTLLLGPTESALSSSDGALRGEDLQMVHRNELRLVKLVNTLLDFSSIEAGRVQAVYERTDLASLTAHIASVFRSAMEKASLAFSVNCEPLTEPIYVDREMWEKVVLNLLSNALKFTFAGAVQVSLQELEDAVQLRVTDTGLGIREEELPRIFDRFYRVESARGRSHEGSGIGLALVEELVKLHGGSITVNSEYGKGSTFTVFIPKGKDHLPPDRIGAGRVDESTSVRAEAYADEALHWLPEEPATDPDNTFLHSSQLLPEEDKTPVGERITRATILVADDNADMRNYLRRLLTVRYQVIAVANGEEAVAAAVRERPDLILTDVMMPVLDGFGLLRAIRDNPATCTIPVIILSARAGEEARVEGLQAGADDYLAKPFTTRELLARIGSNLKMHKLRKDAAEREARLAAIVESSDDAIVSKDLNGVVTSWNQSAERIFGYKAEEVIGKSILLIIPPELHRDEDMILGKIGRGERIDHFETVRVAKNGERIQVSLTISPVKDRAGNIIGAAKIVRDITENKKMERALRTTEKLAAAGRLAATVAHEINNPLEAVNNLVFLARRDVRDTQRVARYLDWAERELDRVAHIARQTLGFYRDSSAPVRFSVAKTLDDLLYLYEKRLETRQIKIARQYEPDVEITGRTGEIRQVFSNLISNSIDAMPAGGSLVIRVARSHQWSNRLQSGVRITILDTGCGIELEDRKNLFEPFFTTKADVGTGLGLWITKNIVEKHGGTIRFRSRTGVRRHGTVFSLFLPSAGQIGNPGQTSQIQDAVA